MTKWERRNLKTITEVTVLDNYVVHNLLYNYESGLKMF